MIHIVCAAVGAPEVKVSPAAGVTVITPETLALAQPPEPVTVDVNVPATLGVPLIIKIPLL